MFKSIEDEETQQEEIRNELLRNAQHAQTLLENPVLQRFFEEERQGCFTAFEALGLDSELKEYQVVHHYLIALNRLRGDIEKHIKAWECQRLQDQQDEEIDTEGVNV